MDKKYLLAFNSNNIEEEEKKFNYWSAKMNGNKKKMHILKYIIYLNWIFTTLNHLFFF